MSKASPDRAIVVADGELDGTQLVSCCAVEPRPWLIAADGAAGRVLAAGLVPDLVVGDLDSIAPAAADRLAELGVDVRRADPDKDESDTELCLLAALEAGARHISLLGAFGLLRPEHGIANLLLLADPRFDEVEVVILGHGSSTRRMGTADGPGALEIAGEPGDFVSLFPLSPIVRGVRTSGLRFPLDGEDLPLGPSRGLSNQLVVPRATLRVERGLLLVVHTDADAEATPGGRP